MLKYKKNVINKTRVIIFSLIFFFPFLSLFSSSLFNLVVGFFVVTTTAVRTNIISIICYNFLFLGFCLSFFPFHSLNLSSFLLHLSVLHHFSSYSSFPLSLSPLLPVSASFYFCHAYFRFHFFLFSFLYHYYYHASLEKSSFFYFRVTFWI